jgi:hypothetical protein
MQNKEIDQRSNCFLDARGVQARLELTYTSSGNRHTSTGHLAPGSLDIVVADIPFNFLCPLVRIAYSRTALDLIRGQISIT